MAEPTPLTDAELADMEVLAAEHDLSPDTAFRLVAEVRRLRALHAEVPALIAETHAPRGEAQRRAAWKRLRELFPGLCEGVTP